MEISNLTLKLVFILIPGAISAITFDKLTVHKPWDSFKFITLSIVFGVFAYLALQIICSSINFSANIFRCIEKPDEKLKLWTELTKETIPYIEVLYASILSIFVGFISASIDHYKVVTKLGKILQVSNKYGDENLYSFFLNAKETQVVYVRSLKNKLTYHGYVKAFAENDSISEIVLSNVSVYDYDTSIELYNVDQIYLSFDKSEIIIEHAIINTEINEETE